MRFVAVILLVVVAALAAQAQDFKLGPKIGLTISGQSYESDFKVPKSGIEFGGLAMVPITYNIYLQAEFLVTQKGYKEKFGSKQLYDQLTSTYWQLPVMVQYRMGDGIEYYGSLGVYAARWMSGKYKSQITEDGGVNEQEYVFTSSYNQEGFKDRRQEFGALVGVGAIVPLSINQLIFDVRYNFGLTDVNDVQSEPAGYSKVSNRSLAITIGMLFSL